MDRIGGCRIQADKGQTSVFLPYNKQHIRFSIPFQVKSTRLQWPLRGTLEQHPRQKSAGTAIAIVNSARMISELIDGLFKLDSYLNQLDTD